MFLISIVVYLILFILFCLLVYYASRITKMIEYYYERDGGKEWEEKMKSKDFDSEEKKNKGPEF